MIKFPNEVDKGLQTKADSGRVALVHDWLTGMRGGEKVLELLCKRFPQAPLWTLLHISGSTSNTIEARVIHTSLLQYMPQAPRKYRNYLPFYPLFAEMTKAHATELVISTSHAVAKAMVRRPLKSRPFHICYIHTPMRYAWDLFDDYFGPQRVGRFASYMFFRPLVKLLQFYDTMTCGRVDLFIANSTYVAERVLRIYGRKAEVLAPPVDTERFSGCKRDAGDRYLVVSALVPYKRIEHAIRACAITKRKLRVVGKGPETESLQRLSTSLSVDAEFIGFASDEMLTVFYSQARALLFPGVEDFGIVPVEAIACGCPVVAFKLGGILDSMTDDTAVFYDEPTEHGLAEAIHRFEMREHKFQECELRARASEFSEAKFLAGFERILERAVGISVITVSSTPFNDHIVAESHL
ncbi:MAG: glycosyltransferase family 4 protein [Acidobacteria bacterium]|nr:glycosyltransferase family 4 protein [Acidobacteriota bacterium]